MQNNGLWEVAVKTIQLTSLGKAIFGSDQLVRPRHPAHQPDTHSGS